MPPMIKLMKNKIRVGGILLLLAITPAWANDKMEHGSGMQYDQSGTYRANELSLDLFGTGSVGRYTIKHLSGRRVRENGELGAGLGLNYFFTRHFGIGGDLYSENDTGALVDSASGNLIGRFPLGDSGFAPYAFAGGGYQFDGLEVGFGQFGAGLEFRFTPHVGLFVDARLVYPEETKYYGLARLGLRFAF
jgi:hypothetical protein